MDPSEGVRDKLEMVGFHRSKFGVSNREKVTVKRGAHPLEQAYMLECGLGGISTQFSDTKLLQNVSSDDLAIYQVADENASSQ